MICCSEDSFEDGSEDNIESHEIWIKNKLRKGTLESMKQFPKEKSIEINGQKMLFLSKNLSSYTTSLESSNIFHLLLSDMYNIRKIDIEDASKYDYIFCGRNGAQELYAETDLFEKPVTIISPGNVSSFMENNVSLLDSNKIELFNSRHFGVEMCVYRTSVKEAEQIKEICREYNFTYNIL